MTGTLAQRHLRGRLPELQGAGVIDFDVLDEPTCGLHLADRGAPRWQRMELE